MSFLVHNQVQVTFIACAMLGGIMHYLKKALNAETNVKIYEWFGASNLTATIYTFIVFFFAIIGAIAADVVNSETGFWAAMYSGFVTGFAIDSGFNSDTNLTSSLSGVKSNLNQLFTEAGVPGEKTVAAASTPSIKAVNADAAAEAAADLKS